MMVITLAIALLTIVAAFAVRYWVFPVLWPGTAPDENQEYCSDNRRELTKKEQSPSGTVRVIRLTDDGEFANRCELTDVIYAIRNVERPEIVVWYIHGWKHNADEPDPDLKSFTKLIKELNEQQLQLKEQDRRHVVGVYVGWDGAVGPVPLQNLTFWNRKRTADTISQSSVLTKIFAATKYAREQRRVELTARDPTIARDLTIMIGHSFGARILHNATSQLDFAGFTPRSRALP